MLSFVADNLQDHIKESDFRNTCLRTFLFFGVHSHLRVLTLCREAAFHTSFSYNPSVPRGQHGEADLASVFAVRHIFVEYKIRVFAVYSKDSDLTWIFQQSFERGDEHVMPQDATIYMVYRLWSARIGQSLPDICNVTQLAGRKPSSFFADIPYLQQPHLATLMYGLSGCDFCSFLTGLGKQFILENANSVLTFIYNQR